MASLPSPAPSSSDLSDLASVDESNIRNESYDKLSSKRKRCVSDSDFDGQPDMKRLHTADSHNRHSATIESPHSDHLFQSLITSPPTFSTAIPGPVAVEAIDNSNVEISVFEYDFGPGHYVSNRLTEDPYGCEFFPFCQMCYVVTLTFSHLIVLLRDPAVSTDLDLFIADLQGKNLLLLEILAY